MNRIEKAYFKVIGMSCINCKHVIEKQLKDKEGIIKFNLNYMTDKVIVEFDPQLTNNEKIKETLEKSGYRFIRSAF